MPERFLGDSFEQSMRDADRLDDQIYANADAVARREELLRQAESIAKRIQQKRDRVTELQIQQAEHRRAMARLRGPSADSNRWLLKCDATMAGRLRSGLRNDRQTRRKPGGNRTACGAESMLSKKRCVSPLPIFADGDMTRVLLSSAHQAVEDAKEHQRRTKELHRDIKRHDRSTR